MSRNRGSGVWGRIVAAGALALALTGCGGGGGGTDSGGTTPPAEAAVSGLIITVTGVDLANTPVIEFTVKTDADAAFTALGAADLRFNIAKWMPAIDGSGAHWQNYINRASGGAVQGSQERLRAGYAFGTLVNHGDGSYTYTFATDIKDAAANVCPAPCTDAEGKALDISYAPTLTHRVAIQQGNSAYPKASGIYDFLPAGGIVAQPDVVANATCNSCHTQLSAHGTRVDVRLCATCHNPGSWVAGTGGGANVTVDLKAMIHRIHYNNGGLQLPSVIAGTPNAIGSHDFSTVVFTQDVRNCTRCHDGTLGASNFTALGDHWKTTPSITACGSCHDNVYFGTTPDATKPYQTIAHSGGVQGDDSRCALCHGAGRYTDAKDIAIAHNFPARLKAAAAKYRFNIISATATGVGELPVVTFSVTDPTNGDAPYDIASAAGFTSAGASLGIKIGWSTTDIGNHASGAKYGQPVSINALTTAVAGAVPGTYTVAAAVPVPAMLPGQAASLRVTMDGRVMGDVTTAGTFTDRLAVKSAFKDFAIAGAVAPRRTVVDMAKCAVCHDTLSLHGGNRTNEPGVCVVCHNPNATDASQRPATAGVLTGGVDGKLEESIDFRTMIHAIHAGEAANGGFREKGITVYGYGGRAVSFAEVVFPGNLANCTACHTATSYQLGGQWVNTGSSGLLTTTSSTGALPDDAADDLKTTWTAAVCASCHDSSDAAHHMVINGALFNQTLPVASAQVEKCSTCHGVGGDFDVKKVHGVK